MLATLDAAGELESFMVDRMVPSPAKEQVVRQLCGGRVQERPTNFLLLLVQRRRVLLVREILEACARMFDERTGIVEAEVRSAVARSGTATTSPGPPL